MGIFGDGKKTVHKLEDGSSITKINGKITAHTPGQVKVPTANSQETPPLPSFSCPKKRSPFNGEDEGTNFRTQCL